MKKILSLFSAVTIMVSGFAFTAFAQESSTLEMGVEMATQAAGDDVAVDFMGYSPSNDGISVQIQDKMMSGKAMVIDGRTLLPFREVFEAMGAKVSYDDVNREIQSQLDNVKLVLSVGSTGVLRVQNDKAEIKQMSVAPLIEDNQTFIPLRDVGELSGLVVEYSSFSKKVNLYDKDKFIADMDKNFTIYNSILKQSASYAMDKTYKSDMEITGDFHLLDNQNVKKASGKLAFDGLSKGLDLNGNFKVSVNLGDFEKDLFDTMTAEEKEIAKSVLVSEHKIIMDNTKSLLYLKSDTASMLLDKSKNTWLKMDMNEIFGGNNPMSMDYITKIMNNTQNTTLGNILYESAANQATILGDMAPSVYDQVQMSAGIVNIMLGDDGFTRSGSNYVMDLNKDQLFNRIQKYYPGMVKKQDMDMLSELNYRLAITSADTAHPEFEMVLNGKAVVDSEQPVVFDFVTKGSNENATMKFSIEEKSMGKLVVNMVSHSVETNQTLQLAPPAGEAVENLL